MLVDLNAAEPRVRAALDVEPPDFAPCRHQSVLAADRAEAAVRRQSQRRSASTRVEIFEQSATGAFAPVETIRDRLLWSPTSIVAVGPRQFYFTNDYGFSD